MFEFIWSSKLIFVRWEVFANYSKIPKIFFSLSIFFFVSYSFFLILIYFQFKNLPGKQIHSKLYAFTLCIFNIKIRYSWILWQIFMNRNNIRQITIFTNRNNIQEMKLWPIGIGIYSWPKYQKIDLWQIYLRPIR